MTSFRRISAMMSDYVGELRRMRRIGAMNEKILAWSGRVGEGVEGVDLGERGMEEVVFGEGEDCFEVVSG